MQMLRKMANLGEKRKGRGRSQS